MSRSNPTHPEAPAIAGAYLCPKEDEPLTPLWEAMDCPDVTDDPFYDDFNQEDE